MGVKVKLLIEAQLFENRTYSEDTSIKTWRPKGAIWFTVTVDSEDLMYSETEKILTEMVANFAKNTDLYKYEYLSHYEVWGGEMWNLSSDKFAEINERLHEEASIGKLDDGESDDAGTDIAIDMGR